MPLVSFFARPHLGTYTSFATCRDDRFGFCLIYGDLAEAGRFLPTRVQSTMNILVGRNLANAYLSICLCTLLAFPVHGQTAQSAHQRMQAVENHLSRYVVVRDGKNDQMNLASQMKELGVPAVSIAAIRNGAIDWTRAYGVSSVQGAPVSTETLFGAASISKPITALGVLKLVEEGQIDLDTDVNQYLKRWNIPDNQFTAKQKVTVRELLNHTSGIGTHNGEIYDPGAPIPTLLQLLEGEKPARTPPVRVEAIPGPKFAYWVFLTKTAKSQFWGRNWKLV
jgi:CubicO group peptidase (beta-lactamase class C family)